MLINSHKERKFPYFMNHKSARMWFKQQWGSSFAMIDTEIVCGEKYYFYHLVRNKEVYLRLRNTEGKREEYRSSFQRVVITETGTVHIYS